MSHLKWISLESWPTTLSLMYSVSASLVFSVVILSAAIEFSSCLIRDVAVCESGDEVNDRVTQARRTRLWRQLTLCTPVLVAAKADQWRRRRLFHDQWPTDTSPGNTSSGGGSLGRTGQGGVSRKSGRIREVSAEPALTAGYEANPGFHFLCSHNVQRVIMIVTVVTAA